MTVSAYAQQVYQRTEVESSDPKRLVVMLFDAAVRFLHQAAEAMARRDCEQQCHLITRAQRILTELTCALDDDADRELSGNLRLLYTWLHTQLSEASIEDDSEKLSQVITIVEDLRNTWTKAEIACRRQAA